jgi:hypothetical protein
MMVIIIIIVVITIKFLIYLRAELNTQWPITESARIQTTAIRQTLEKRTNKKIEEKVIS